MVLDQADLLKQFSAKFVESRKSRKDKTGYYLANSRETLSQKNLEQLSKEKESIVQELTTNNRVERYRTVFKFCELYQSWALAKKSEQAEDITKQEKFEIHSELSLKIVH